MWQRTPASLALPVAIAGSLLTLVLISGDLWLARERTLKEGQDRLQHVGLMMSEHTARTFGNLSVLLREIAGDLARQGKGWLLWDGNRGWEYLAQRHSRSMPQLRSLSLLENNGALRFVSSHYQVIQENIAEQPYFKTIASGSDTANFGPFVERSSRQYTYALAQRVLDDEKRFNGLLIAAIEPLYFQEFCWPNRISEEFEAFLVNGAGLVIASCRPADQSRQSQTIGKPVDSLLFGGRVVNRLPASGSQWSEGVLLNKQAVPGYKDLAIVTAIPESNLLEPWQFRRWEMLALWLCFTGILFASAWFIRRQFRAMESITCELNRNKEELQQKINQATAELTGRKDAAERANAAKSRFLAAASHDLRQPLHALSLFVTDLLRRIRQGDFNDLGSLGQQIATSTRTLGDLLNSLLDLSRLDVEGVRPDIQTFPLDPLFERLAGHFKRALEENELTLHIRNSGSWVLSDPALLEQMLANLISNAIRYTPRHGRILLAARQRGDNLRIEVRDNGMGISNEHQKAIFSEFYQVGNEARESDKGLGLGLSIVERLARALDIHVELRSRIGEGSIFGLLVKRAAPPAAKPVSLDETPGIRVHCLGDSEEMQDCLGLIARWDYDLSYAANMGPERLPSNALLIVDQDFAQEVANQLLPDSPLIVLVRDDSQEIPGSAHCLHLPLRPAKLRALLTQLQKTLSSTKP